MPAVDEPAVFTSGLRKQVDAANIERELARLWETAGAAEEGTAPSTTRACLLNLIALCTREKHATMAARTAGLLVGTHPSRSLVVTAYPQDPSPSMESWVAAHCSLMPGGAAQVCCEQISLLVRGDAVRFLPATLSTLLVPDLPTFLWLPDDIPVAVDILARIAELSDKVLLDTASLSDLTASVPILHDLLKRSRDTAFGDLAWARLSGWREAVASLFDDPEAAALLPSVGRVKASYTREKGPGEALLLCGWLASRLGWEPSRRVSKKQGGMLLLLDKTQQRQDMKPPQVEFDLVPETGPPGCEEGLLSVTVEVVDGRQGAAFRVRPGETPRSLTAAAERVAIQPSTRIHRTGDSEMEVLMCQALESTVREPSWEAAFTSVTRALSIPLEESS
jgi:glucose-6-phosphate dehydrogenase assembly protein OpcA